jgi:hypothetical protein
MTKPTKKRRPPQHKPTPLTDDATATAVEELVVLICRDVPEPMLLKAARERHNVDDLNARKLLAAARRKLTLAARYHRDREIGLAYKRLNGLFASSLQASQNAVALAAQKELNKLLSLYSTPEIETQDSGSPANTAAETAIRDHLVPLALADESAPLVEHVRIAALRLMDTSLDE